MNTLPPLVARPGRRRPLGFPLWVSLLLFSLVALPGQAEQPIPQIEAGGPTSYVTSLAFSPDGLTLYAAGWDKTVQVWRRPHPLAPLQSDPVSTFRVPLGPGLNGAINALAVSADGRWLAVGGRSVVAGGSGFRDVGRIIPATAMTKQMKLDQGVIYVFDTQTREVRTLSGHYGEVLALTFATGSDDRPFLASAARERDYRAGRENQEAGVVRFWDVLNSEPATQRVAGIMLPTPQVRPVLNAWRIGPGSKGFRVALAWGDRKLRLWDLARNGLTELPTEGANDNVMAPIREGLLLAGQTRGADGRLGRFTVGADGRMRQSGAWNTAFGRQGNTVWAPRLAAVTRSSPGGATDLAAMVLVRGTLARQGEQDVLVDKTYELRLVFLDGPRFGQTAATVDLWSGEGQFQPALAVSSQGTIAVGGNDEQAIQVFHVESLLGGGGPVQQLQGSGVPLAKVDFVQKGNVMGLKLEPRETTMGPVTPPLLLDVQRRRLESWPTDNSWSSPIQPAGDWRVQLPTARPGESRNAALRIVLLRGGTAWQRIELEAGRELTATAFTEAHDPPLLAVATRGNDEVQLTLYDAISGKLIRYCTAHTLPIHSLRFSPDGRLLASAADDGIACIWSTVDLPETLGKRGAPGVQLEPRDGKLRVTEAPPELREFRKGDVIQGGVIGDLFTPWENLGEVYEAAWRRSPGESLTVRRLRGSETAEVLLPIVQGADERKPLFSLFVARNEDPRDIGAVHWSWLAFTPLGPFDSSNSDVERYLGWHINTGNPRTPTSFARADQYREQYRQEGLLARLWDQGRLAQVEPSRPLTRPTLSLFFPDQEGPENLAGQNAAGIVNLLREIPDTIQLSVYGLSSHQIEKVSLWAGDREVAQFEEMFEHQWSANLSGLDWSRGTNQFRASLVTREAAPQTFQAEINAVYFPAAPQLAMDLPTGSLTSNEQLELDFRVAADKQDKEIEWSIIHHHGEEVTTVAQGRSIGDATIRRSVLQRPGMNRFEIIASNVPGEGPRSPLETTGRRISTIYQPEVTAPTLLTIQQVELIDASGQIAEQIRELESLVRTSEPALKISGTVIASQTPRAGTWKLGDREGNLILRPASRDEPARFETPDPIELSPGEQLIRLSVQLSDSVNLEAELPVHFQPGLPEVNMLAPLDGQEFIEGEEEAVAIIQAQISVADSSSYSASLLHNGKLEKELSIDSGGRISGSVGLIPGENRLQVRIQRPEEETSRDTVAIVVLYRQPPQVQEVQITPPGDSPFVDMSVQGTSTTRPSRLEVQAGTERIRVVPASLISWHEDAGTWNATIPQLPLRRGTNMFRVFAQNQDGLSLQPGEAQVEYAPAPPPLAEVQFLAPATDLMTTETEYTAILYARSRSPFRQIRLTHNSQEIHRNEMLQDLRANREGWFEQEERVQVMLAPGTNFFKGFVVNDGGEAPVQARVTYHFQPVRLEILALSGGGRGGIPEWRLTPRHGTGVDVIFDKPVPTGQLQIHGRVIWERPDARRTRQRMPLHVWVNGFHQAPVQLEMLEDDSNVRSFTASIVLNKSDNNTIELTLPRLSTESDCPLTTTVNCVKPVLERRLHLAIIGVGVSLEQTPALEQRALDAFQATRPPGKKTEFETPAFKRGWVYGPITDERVNRYRIQGLLDQIKRSVNSLSRYDPMNDVVVIYYEGGEIVYEEEQFFLTTREATTLGDLNPEIVKLSSVGSQLLSEFFASMGGAHLMFLDVVRGREGLTQRAVLPNDRRTALLRFAWLRDAETPQEASLILAVRDVLSGEDEVSDLGSVVQRIGTQFVPDENVLVSRRFGESLIFQQRVPPAISDLIVGQR
jgi:WD40 repeat protein